MRTFVRLHDRMCVKAPMKMKMEMGLATVRVRMNMDARTLSQREVQKPRSKHDDHQCNAEFENIGDTFGNGDTQNNHQQTSNEKGTRVPQSPERADSCRLPKGWPLADDGGNRGKVVRFCRVLQSKRETQTESQQDRILHRDGSLYRS